MQIYSARTQFKSDTEAEVAVVSTRCPYQVWVNSAESLISIQGPGVSIQDISTDDWPNLDDEDLAILSILMFENGEIDES